MLSEKESARSSYGEKCEMAWGDHSLPLAAAEPQAARGDEMPSSPSSARVCS